MSGTCRIGHGWFMWLAAEEQLKGAPNLPPLDAATSWLVAAGGGDGSLKVHVPLKSPSYSSPKRSMAFVPGSYAMEAP